MITNHHFIVAENIAIGTVIGTVKASDDAVVTSYLIITGNASYAFGINTNGQIKNIMRLDYDTTSNYSLAIQVSDAAGNTSNATVTVNITDVDAAPSVATLNTSDIKNNSVTLNGNITYLGTNNDGGQQVNKYGFVYSTNASHTNNLQLEKSGVQGVVGANPGNVGTYSQIIAGLSPGSTYYFRAFAVNDGGTSYGEVSNFSTTCHQSFDLESATNTPQSNLLCAYSVHTYNVPLSHQKAYSLSLEAVSNVSANVNIYEGTNTSSLYIKKAPFSESAEFITITFSTISNGGRYMVLPLASNTHRIVVSNNSSQNENYSLKLEEYTGTNPTTGRLLTTPDKMGYYDSTNDTRFFWAHVPPNKDVRVDLDALRTRSDGNTAVIVIGTEDAVFGSFFQDPDTFSISRSDSQYRLLQMRNTSGVTSNIGQQTIARLIFSFVDP